ncbi:MAG TPA: DedA family protein [Nitrososphaera sp.]|jgi:membrane protein DedA with SNARE-associated domain
MGAAIIIVLMSTGLVGGVIDAITGLVAEYGYPAVFAAALLEVIFPPIPSEVVFPLVGFTVQSRGLGLENAIGMAATGALGSTVGAVFIYFISMKVGRAAIVRFGRRVKVSEHEIEKAERWFVKYGPIAVFTARMVPGIREIISIPAGIGRMNLAKFIAYTFAGSFVWSVILTLAGYYLGEAWSSFSAQASMAFTIVSIILIGAIVAGIGIWYTRRIRAHAKESD